VERVVVGQVLEDTLRPYDELVAVGHDPETVRRVIPLVDRSEYNRRQASPGVKVTTRAFGRDRRMPHTNRYLPDAIKSTG
jgi:NAD+ synthase (glutamine-hydrolysing)